MIWLVAGQDLRWATDAPATFVGARACAGCHAEETRAWRGSQHDQAMQEATPATVLGDFADASFTHYGVTSRFYRKGDGFFVTTDGPGRGHARIRDRLHLRRLPAAAISRRASRAAAGRRCSLAWDTRPKEQGGQRWFHLYPDEKIAHGDELHWTGINQNWNWMCADCHSTNLRARLRPEDATATTPPGRR